MTTIPSASKTKSDLRLKTGQFTARQLRMQILSVNISYCVCVCVCVADIATVLCNGSVLVVFFGVFLSIEGFADF